jgi:hypothetical protein
MGQTDWGLWWEGQSVLFFSDTTYQESQNITLGDVTNRVTAMVGIF